MNIQSLISEHDASFLHPHQHDEVPLAALSEERENDFGSIRIPIHYPLLLALDEIKRSSPDRAESSMNEVRKLLKKYCEEKKLTETLIPEDILEQFTDVDKAHVEDKEIEIDWEGVVLKLHQSVVETPSLWDMTNTLVRREKEKLSQQMRRVSSVRKMADGEGDEGDSSEEEPEENRMRLLKNSNSFIAIKPPEQIEAMTVTMESQENVEPLSATSSQGSLPSSGLFGVLSPPGEGFGSVGSLGTDGRRPSLAEMRRSSVFSPPPTPPIGRAVGTDPLTQNSLGTFPGSLLGPSSGSQEMQSVGLDFRSPSFEETAGTSNRRPSTNPFTVPTVPTDPTNFPNFPMAQEPLIAVPPNPFSSGRSANLSPPNSQTLSKSSHGNADRPPRGPVVFVDPIAERNARGNSYSDEPDTLGGPWDAHFSDEDEEPSGVPIKPVTSFGVGAPSPPTSHSSLPPTRLTESMGSHPSSGISIGPSAIYSKAPLIDPFPSHQSQPSQGSPLSVLASQTPAFPRFPDRQKYDVVVPSSFFSKSEKKETRDLPPPKKSVEPFQIEFPEWFRFVLYWGSTVRMEVGVMIELDMVLLALTSAGHYDHSFQGALWNIFDISISRGLKQDLFSADLQDCLRAHQASHPPPLGPTATVEYLRSELDLAYSHRWTTERYDHYVETFLFAPTPQTFQEVESDLLLFLRINDKVSLRHLERLLIGLLGDARSQNREKAARLLNLLYDGHDWQAEEPLVPVIRAIGDTFEIEVDLGGAQPEGEVSCLIHMPSPTAPTYILSRHIPERKGSRLVVSPLPSFPKPGFYDWRFVFLSPEGSFTPLGSHLLPQTQGRVIVQPPLRDELMHEVWVELQDCDWDRGGGSLLRKGSFSSVARSLEDYKRTNGVTSLYVMGALDRPPWANPFAPIDRATPNRWLGGEKGFQELVKKAQDTGIKIVVDATARISGKLAHRKYKEHLCYTVDEDETLRVHPATDGKEFLWEDSALLNWRKKEVWDLMIKEIRQWALRGVGGVRLDSAQSWPLLLKADHEELIREDSDGEFHYTLQEMIDGVVVTGNRWDEGWNYGFHGTDIAKTYPNPFFIKLVKELWIEFPQFFFLAEVFWNREASAISSGLIPYTAGLNRGVGAMYGVGVQKDGSLLPLPSPPSVSPLYDWYQERAKFPQNCILLNSSASHHLPYPTALFGSGAWAAVDLLYFLPEVPMTFVGEQEGWTQKLDLSLQRFSALPGRARGDLPSIGGHYRHRAGLRRTYAVLREGGMVPLLACHAGGWHDRVFAFCRFTKEDNPELAVIAVNFNDAESRVYLDLSPLKQICRAGGNIIYRVQDLINSQAPPKYFTPEEFLGEKNFLFLPPYGSICWGVFVIASTAGTERVLFEHSMARLEVNLQLNLDPGSNLIYAALMEGFTSLPSFEKTLADLHRRHPGGDPYKIPSFLQNVLTHLTQRGDVTDTSALALLAEAAESQNTIVRDIAFRTLKSNQMGPIVFVTPEIGRFSTVGGVGVMVDELTQSLAALGLEVHIISPYYNYNRKGKTNYLAGEGIEYTKNIVTYIGHEYVELGVHEGKEHGVHLHFLHNFKYFTAPYETGSPVHQLQQIVLMAKSALEFCCQTPLLPQLIVTNDWFTGLVAAYAKKSGSFGETFKGTNFLHIVHNLEIGYEGKIYLDHNDDLSYLHQLPRELIVDPHSRQLCLNSSRCALISSDQWATVSESYRNDLMRVSPLSYLLCQYPAPFAKLNGIRLSERLQLLKKVAKDHESAKAEIQAKYFGEVDPSIPVFAFVGRIVLQKGVHLVLNAIRELMDYTRGRIQILIGGMANMKDPYAAQCAWSMQAFRKQYKNRFWADPQEFFTDGTLVNIGADFALMPSLFEPSGVVQQEFFAGGTPVIAFKTGGLKDTIFEYSTADKTGNGFTFEAHAHGDFVLAMKRAIAIFNDQAEYTLLRQNARNSVLDVHIQAMGWTREFARLSRRFWSDPDSIQKTRQELRDKQEPTKDKEKDKEKEKGKEKEKEKEEKGKEKEKESAEPPKEKEKKTPAAEKVNSPEKLKSPKGTRRKEESEAKK